MAKRKNRGQSGGVHISGGQVKVGGDIVGGDKISTGNVSGTGIAIGRGAKAVPDLAALLAEWQAQMENRIDAHPALSADEKKDAKDQIAKIQTEAAKAEQADPSRLEKLLNTLVVLAPDIFEVAVTTLANPLSGIGLVLKKIGDKAKLERKAQAGA
jgi:hypothetical protein